jgi:DNA-binding MarR family transcriptional regulator
VTPVADDEIRDGELSALWREITTAAGRLQRQLDAALEAAGIPAQRYPALDLLLSADGHRLPMSALARRTTMTSGGFSKLADRMAADGLIDRRGTDADRRVVHATLTEDGVALARRAREIHARALREHLGLTGVTGGLDDAAGAATGATAGDVVEALRAAAAALRRLAPEPDTAPDAPPGVASEHFASERDPALPDRRGRGRMRGPHSV